MIVRSISILTHIKHLIYSNQEISEGLLELNRRERELWSKMNHSDICSTPQIVMSMATCDNFEHETRKTMENAPIRITIYQIFLSAIHGLSAYLLWPS